MMDKHIEVIGIDHGWSNMKTVSSIFTTGVKEITTEPAFYDNVVESDGVFYKVGGKRQLLYPHACVSGKGAGQTRNE